MLPDDQVGLQGGRLLGGHVDQVVGVEGVQVTDVQRLASLGLQRTQGIEQGAVHPRQAQVRVRGQHQDARR